MSRLTSSQRAIITRCKDDPIFFVDNFMKVKHPKAGVLPFHPWGYQRKIIKATRKYKYNITWKPRQAGVSKIAGAIGLHTALFNNTSKVLIVSRKDEDAKDFLADNIKLPFYHLPEWMQDIWGEPKDNEHELEFRSNNSLVRSLTSHPNVLRSHASTLNIIDEAAHIQNMDALWAAGFSTLQHGGGVLAISTTNGVGDWFWSQCTEAEAGQGVFNLIKINWTDMTWAIEFYDSVLRKTMRIAPTEGIRKCETKEEVEKYGEWWSPWLEEQYRGLVEKGEPWKFDQEVLARFVGSGRTIIDKLALAEAKLHIDNNYDRVVATKSVYYNRGDIEETVDFNTNEKKEGLWIWEHPPEGAGLGNFVIGVDFATGKGNDYHAAQILNADTRSQAGELMIHNKPHEFLRMLVWLAYYYKMAMIVPERNNGGDQLIDNLLYDWCYSNIWRRIEPSKNPKAKVNTVTYGEYGHFTSDTTKAHLVRLLIQNITTEEDRFRIYSSRLVSQLEIFIRKRDKSGRDTGKIGAQSGPGNFDDLVMAFALGLTGCLTAMPIDKSIMLPWHSQKLPSSRLFPSDVRPSLSDPVSLADKYEKLSDTAKALLPPMPRGAEYDYNPNEDMLNSLLRVVGDLDIPATVAPRHRFK